ncbi:MAG TPA: type III-A CRISPR-associated RAMP protein Csm5 [Anaerolineaceae bacterium]
MTVFKLNITAISPLHIGDGGELRHGFDFMVFENSTYRLNEDAILDQYANRLTTISDGDYPLPGKLLQSTDYNNKRLFRYILPGFPRSRREDARVKSCIKDVYDRPYIPGSSLKGAMRTALAWTGWQEVNPRLDRSAIGRSRSWAGQPLEKRLFGPDPNHDLLRALQVSDCHALPEKPAQLMLINAQVLTKRSAGSPIELEAIRPNSEFVGTLHVDETLFSAQAEGELHFSNRRAWLNQLVTRLRKHSRARLEMLAEWFEKADNSDAIANAYRKFLNTPLPENAAFVQLGWGGGWDSKTFWTHLTKKDPLLFEQLVREFRMHKASPGSPPRKAGDPFPRSKRVAMQIKNGVAAPAAPFGWVLLELEKLS